MTAPSSLFVVKMPVMHSAIYCPICSYDLRGHRSERCPECGHTISWEVLARSQIPWVHRKKRGSLRAYAQTVYVILQRPRTLASELSRSARPKDAHRFAEISWAVGTALSILMLLLAFALGGAGWRIALGPVSDAAAGIWWWPVRALMDSPLIILCSVPSIAVSWWVSMQMMRWIIASAGRDRRVRRRLWVMSNYLWGIVPLEALLLGLPLVCLVISSDEPPWMPWAFFHVLMGVNLLSAILAGGVYFLSVLQFVGVVAQGGVGRLLFATFILPPVQISVWVLLFAGTCWTIGYLILALWSTFH